MGGFQQWLEQKYKEWSSKEKGSSSYYAFARYLDVGQSTFSLWITGAAVPTKEELTTLAAKLGEDVYRAAGVEQTTPLANSFLKQMACLPLALQARLKGAVAEAGETITANKLDPESVEAKRVAVRVFEKWGFRVSG